MLSKNLFKKLHYLLIFLLFILCLLLPLKYIKYIAWMPLAVVFHWIIYNGCILDKLHDKDSTGNVVSCIKLLNKKLGEYLSKKYFKNTNRGSYITSFIFISYSTIIIYRLIYNIDIL